MYNVESYVERCLRSLEDQDIPKDNYEIICINDGSPDDSRGVVIRLQKEFKNILLIDQDNQGVSRARNNGIDKAESRYLMFIDPDDYVDPNSFKKILKIPDEKQAQVSFLGFDVLNKDGSVRNHILNKDKIGRIYLGTEAYLLARGDGYIDPDRMWGVLFENEFINNNNLRYLPEVPYLEDGEFIARILCLAERCIFDDHPFYLRTIRVGSATNSGLFNSESSTNGFIRAAINLRNFKDTMPLSSTKKEFMNQPVVKFVVLSISSTAKLVKFRMFLKTYSILKKNHFKQLDLKGCHKYYRQLGSLYNYSGFLLYSYLTLRPLGLFIRNMRHKSSK